MKKNYIYRSPKSWHRAPKTLRIWILIWKKKKKKELYRTIRKLWTRIISFVGCDHSGGCSFSHVWLSDTMDHIPTGSSVHGNFPGKITGMGCHFLLQGIFLTQVIMAFGPFFFSSSLRVLLEMACWNCLLIKLRWGLQSTLYHLPKKKKTNQPTIKINISIYPSKSSLESLALEKLKSNVKG